MSGPTRVIPAALEKSSWNIQEPFRHPTGDIELAMPHFFETTEGER